MRGWCTAPSATSSAVPRGLVRGHPPCFRLGAYQDAQLHHGAVPPVPHHFGFSIGHGDRNLIVEHYRKGLLFGIVVALGVSFLNIEVIQHRHTLASPPNPISSGGNSRSKPCRCSRSWRIGPVVYQRPWSTMYLPCTTSSSCSPRAWKPWTNCPQTADVVRLRAHGYTVFAIQDGEPLERFPPGVEVIKDAALQFPRVGQTGVKSWPSPRQQNMWFSYSSLRCTMLSFIRASSCAYPVHKLLIIRGVAPIRKNAIGYCMTQTHIHVLSNAFF